MYFTKIYRSTIIVCVCTYDVCLLIFVCFVVYSVAYAMKMCYLETKSEFPATTTSSVRTAGEREWSQYVV